MAHSFISIISELLPNKDSLAIEALNKLGNPLIKPLADIVDETGRVHFFSLTIVPGDKKTPAYLVFELTIDGDTNSLLKQLADSAHDYLDPVFRLTKRYTHKLSLDILWLRQGVQSGNHFWRTQGLNHVGTPGMSVNRIRREAQLSKTITSIYHQTEQQSSALETVKKIKSQLSEEDKKRLEKPLPAVLLEGQKPGSLAGTAASRIGELVLILLWPLLLVALVISLWLAWPIDMSSVGTLVLAVVMTAFSFALISTALSLTAIGIFYAKLRGKEKTDLSNDAPPNHLLLSDIKSREDHCSQNHLAGVSIMKPGLIRGISLRLIFWLIGTLGARLYRPGFLGDIGTIHFARWLIIPGTNRLLFFSNFSGSWESYLEDFINKAKFGLTGVWSNTLGFPKAKNLVLGGAADGDRFKRWARRQQNPTWSWYSAYPTLTTERIRTNAAIVQGLSGMSTETEARDWLTLFGSKILPRTELESSNIQGLLFGGFGPLAHSTCLTIKLPNNIDSAKKWLSEIIPKIYFGDKKPKSTECATIVSLTAKGLDKLGLTESELAQFPQAFVSGMAARANILGDEGSSQPESWQWGSERPVDAAIMLYASTAKKLDAQVAAEMDRLSELGGELVYCVALKALPKKGTPVREPFGFVDGVSQPVIRGIGRHKPGTHERHIIEPGEFILGYPDGLGTYPQTPTVPPLADSHNDLYSEPNAWPTQRPNFSRSLVNQSRDLGRDGSFMVIRQLEQDVEGFDHWLTQTADTLSEHQEKPVTPEWLSAKMVGRWQDGSSLVRNPNGPATAKSKSAKPDNDFLHGKEDPQGLACPFGSHVRRANPRDSQAPKSQAQINISNRHRILRVGRVYEEGDKQGLLFICLNGDIERQFEFIQQTWTHNKNFHGLDNEVDPLTANSTLSTNEDTSGTFSIPTQEGTRCVKGLDRFVHTRGGDYFFLPGKQALHFLTRKR